MASFNVVSNIATLPCSGVEISPLILISLLMLALVALVALVVLVSELCARHNVHVNQPGDNLATFRHEGEAPTNKLGCRLALWIAGRPRVVRAQPLHRVIRRAVTVDDFGGRSASFVAGAATALRATKA